MAKIQGQGFRPCALASRHIHTITRANAITRSAKTWAAAKLRNVGAMMPQ